MPKVLVIIVTWNKKEYVLDLLAALQNISYPKTSFDIIVVDNASNDGTIATIQSGYPDVQFICNPKNIGGSGGFNTGLKWAFDQSDGNYDYLWLLDNDVLVHQRALIELVELLEGKPDAAIAGSTMMQLDYPWRVNEIGAFLNRNKGELILNCHNDEIDIWKDYPASDLISRDIGRAVEDVCGQPFMAVEYVAATSLLIKEPVARSAGLWMDFFIHYDDVEWCLRIANMGHKILVSSRSVIWHMSAAAKVPTWVLYYDNRNVLFLLDRHRTEKKKMRKVRRRILLKALFYTLIGKKELGGLHFTAIDDFRKNRMGKRDIQLSLDYRSKAEGYAVFENPSLLNVLLSRHIDIDNTWIGEMIRETKAKRPEMRIDVLTEGDVAPYNDSGINYVTIPTKRLLRTIYLWRLKNKYDLVLQSDYSPAVSLSWLSKNIMFVNDDGFCMLPSPKIKNIFSCLRAIAKRWPFGMTS